MDHLDEKTWAAMALPVQITIQAAYITAICAAAYLTYHLFQRYKLVKWVRQWVLALLMRHKVTPIAL